MNDIKYWNDLLLNNFKLPKNFKDFDDLENKTVLQLKILLDCIIMYMYNCKNISSK